MESQGTIEKPSSRVFCVPSNSNAAGKLKAGEQFENACGYYRPRSEGGVKSLSGRTGKSLELLNKLQLLEAKARLFRLRAAEWSVAKPESTAVGTSHACDHVFWKPGAPFDPDEPWRLRGSRIIFRRPRLEPWS